MCPSFHLHRWCKYRTLQAPARPEWHPLLETKPDFQRIMDINTMRAGDDVRTYIPSPYPRAWSKNIIFQNPPPCLVESSFCSIVQRHGTRARTSTICAVLTFGLLFVTLFCAAPVEIPQVKDIRQSKWDVYHGKFPQAPLRRFRRTNSAPCQVLHSEASRRPCQMKATPLQQRYYILGAVCCSG